MRVLHTIPDSGWAGREERVLETCLWQRANGHQAWIAAPPNNELHSRAPKHLALKYSPTYEGTKRLREIAEELQIDVLDSHGLCDTSVAVLAGLPVPVVHSRHCLLRESDTTANQRFIWRKLDRVIAVAKAIRSELLDHSMVDADRIDVIGEWVLPSFFEPADARLIARTRSEISLSAHQPAVAFVGLMREEKGIDIFLRAAALACASLPDLRVVVVGANTSAKGTNRDELRALHFLWRTLGAPGALVTTGFRDDINVILKSVDLLVVPSLREAQSRVIPQAFASKTAVIASAVGGISELVVDDVTGWLVSPNDPAALAGRIVAAMRDPKARSTVAENAYKVAREHLRLDDQMQNTIATYEHALQTHRNFRLARHAAEQAEFNHVNSETPFSHLHVMIVVAHPDDEVLGAATAMADFRRLTLVHITDGAPSLRMAWKRGYPTRSSYSRARFRELHRALTHMQIEMNIVNLGARDQHAALEMPRLTQSLLQLFAVHKPDAILTHAFEGGHPDHDATAFAVHAAQRECSTQIPVFEMSGYHNAFGVEAYGTFIPRDEAPEITIWLAPETAARKRAMLAEFVSQRRTIASFATYQERFRSAPKYDFAKRPHEGNLFYERYPFGMTWSRWQQLVKIATDKRDRE
jgi:glycosyltransferase involved in cell wall biosynthesis/LmbE family N-acetylglucosaminyl deacetylase